MTSEVFFGPELAFMAWRAENPELFCLIVVVSMLFVTSLCLFWYVCDRDRKIYAAKVARERKIKRAQIRAEGGL